MKASIISFFITVFLLSPLAWVAGAIFGGEDNFPFMYWMLIIAISSASGLATTAALKLLRGVTK